MTEKLERLQELSRHSDFSALVPPLIALPSEIVAAITGQRRETRTEEIFADYVHQVSKNTEWREQVYVRCGPAPWIVRSAGAEDGEKFVNAGAYASIVCTKAEDLSRVIAAVAFSGFAQHAVAQQRLVEPAYEPQVIPCFVQSLITQSDCSADLAQVPYLCASECARLLKIIARLHAHLDYRALDTEWVLETEQGLVSVTGMTLSDAQGPKGQFGFGFGFGAAQSPGRRENSQAWYWPGLEAPLWRGERFIQVTVRKIWLVQVRPAPGYTLERQVEKLTDEALGELSRQYRAVSISPILPSQQPRQGSFLCATTLESAWNRYLELPQTVRDSLVSVFVESGVATEHAGIMFRQQGLSVFRTELTQLPTAPSVVIDSVEEMAWFGTLFSPSSLKTESAQCLDLPADVQWIFDDDSVKALTPKLAFAQLDEALSKLPSSLGSIRQTIAYRSAWPTNSWLQCVNRVRSTSLFGWLLEHVGTQSAEILRPQWQAFAKVKAYVDAAIAFITPEAALPDLCSEYPTLASELYAQHDMRLVMQLIETQAWVARLPQAGLASLAYAALSSSDDRSLLDCTLRMLAHTEELAVYDVTDQLFIVRALRKSIKAGVKPVDLLLAAQLGRLAPTTLATLACAPDSFRAYMDFLTPLECFKTAATAGGPIDTPQLLEAMCALQRALQSAGLSSLFSLCRIDLIDTFDQTLKMLLSDVVERRDPVTYRRYLDLLASWIDFARTQQLTSTDDAALVSLLGWIQTARETPVPQSFHLQLDEKSSAQLGDEFLRWQALMPVAGCMEPKALPIKNPHQLHNLLHQWMLIQFRAETGAELPQGVRELLAIADSFGDARSCLLRLGRSTLEISLPIVVHKASFLFTGQNLTVEVAELRMHQKMRSVAYWCLKRWRVVWANGFPPGKSHWIESVFSAPGHCSCECNAVTGSNCARKICVK